MYAIRSYYEILLFLERTGLKGKSASSNIEGDLIGKVRSHFRKGVITSYSIHYTKLYEFQEQQDLLAALHPEFLGKLPYANLLHPLPPQVILPSHDVPGLPRRQLPQYKRAVRTISRNGESSFRPRPSNLPESPPATPPRHPFGSAAPPSACGFSARNPRCSVITSYSIHYTKLYDTF